MSLPRSGRCLTAGALISDVLPILGPSLSAIFSRQSFRIVTASARPLAVVEQETTNKQDVQAG